MAIDVNYHDWLSALFDHDPAEGDWRFEDVSPALDVDDRQAVRLVRRLLENIREDTEPYNDWQVALGIAYMFDPGGAAYDVRIRDGYAPFPEGVAAIRAMKYLYSDCFELRCRSALSNCAGPSPGPLNGTCYMLWDVTALSYFNHCKQRTELYEEAMGVMACALKMKNVACIESGLHGLGHMVSDYPPAKGVIREFLQRERGLGPALKNYAEAAQTGYIQ